MDRSPSLERRRRSSRSSRCEVPAAAWVLVRRGALRPLPRAPAVSDREDRLAARARPPRDRRRMRRLVAGGWAARSFTARVSAAGLAQRWTLLGQGCGSLLQPQKSTFESRDPKPRPPPHARSHARASGCACDARGARRAACRRAVPPNSQPLPTTAIAATPLHPAAPPPPPPPPHSLHDTPPLTRARPPRTTPWRAGRGRRAEQGRAVRRHVRRGQACGGGQ